MGKIAQLLAAHKVAVIDTNCFIYHLQADQFPSQAPVVGELFEMVERGRINAVTSPITVVEIMTQPRMPFR